MVRSIVGIVTLGALVAAPTAYGQRPKRDDRPADPQSQVVPPKMCRIWLDGVRADSQPAPTDCVTAMRNRPRNARIIFGTDSGERSSPRRPVADSTRPTDDRRARPDKKKKPEKPE